MTKTLLTVAVLILLIPISGISETPVEAAKGPVEKIFAEFLAEHKLARVDDISFHDIPDEQHSKSVAILNDEGKKEGNIFVCLSPPNVQLKDEYIDGFIEMCREGKPVKSDGNPGYFLPMIDGADHSYVIAVGNEKFVGYRLYGRTKSVEYVVSWISVTTPSAKKLVELTTRISKTIVELSKEGASRDR